MIIHCTASAFCQSTELQTCEISWGKNSAPKFWTT